MASRTQITLTFIKVFALVLIIIPGVIALAKGVCVCVQLLPLQRLIRLQMAIICRPRVSFYAGKTENFQNGFEVDAITLDRLPLAFYNGLYAYGGW